MAYLGYKTREKYLEYHRWYYQNHKREMNEAKNKWRREQSKVLQGTKLEMVNWYTDKGVSVRKNEGVCTEEKKAYAKRYYQAHKQELTEGRRGYRRELKRKYREAIDIVRIAEPEYYKHHHPQAKVGIEYPIQKYA